MNKYVLVFISLLVLALIAFNLGLGTGVNKSSNGVATVSEVKTVENTTTNAGLESEVSELDKAKQEPLIGGSYELVDKNGKAVKSDNFLGKKQIVFFGFTNCPMICPTATNNISILMNELGDYAQNYTPVFISVDPARDTPARLNDYFSNMHPSFVALTGSIEQIEVAKKAFKVYSEQVANPEDKANYDLNHSSIIYILDEQGTYLTHFSHETSVEVMAKKLKSYEQKKL